MESDCERDLSHSVAVAKLQSSDEKCNQGNHKIKPSTAISAAILAAIVNQLVIGPCAFLHLDLVSWEFVPQSSAQICAIFRGEPFDPAVTQVIMELSKSALFLMIVAVFIITSDKIRVVAPSASGRSDFGIFDSRIKREFTDADSMHSTTSE